MLAVDVGTNQFRTEDEGIVMWSVEEKGCVLGVSVLSVLKSRAIAHGHTRSTGVEQHRRGVLQGSC